MENTNTPESSQRDGECLPGRPTTATYVEPAAPTRNTNDRPGEAMPQEVRRIIEECYEQAVETLRASGDRPDRLAQTLLDHETLEEGEAYAAAGISREVAPAGTAVGETSGSSK